MGSMFGGHLIRRRTSKAVTVLGVAILFVCSLSDFCWNVISGAEFNGPVYTWATIGNLKLEIGFLVDKLTAMMMVVVTFISLLVHIYSMGYMENDDNVSRFFSYISLFTFSMLSLVMSNNFLQLLSGSLPLNLSADRVLAEELTAVSAGLKLSSSTVWAISGSLSGSGWSLHLPVR